MRRVEASSFFFLWLAAQEGEGEEGGDGEEAAPVAEPGAGGETGAAQEDRRRHPPPGSIQAGSTIAHPTPVPHLAIVALSSVVDSICVDCRLGGV